MILMIVLPLLPFMVAKVFFCVNDIDISILIPGRFNLLSGAFSPRVEVLLTKEYRLCVYIKSKMIDISINTAG